MKKKIDMAAALGYNPKQDSAPVVVAVGRGDLAEQIRKVAREENVPIYHDEVLASTLVKLGAGTEIPPELYQVVAHILVHISRLDQRLGVK